MSKKDEFQIYKTGILEKFPHAKTMFCDIYKAYYVADENGLQLIPNELTLNNSKTVFDAWKYAYKNMKFIDEYEQIEKNVIKRNTDYFLHDGEYKSKMEMLTKQH